MRIDVTRAVQETYDLCIAGAGPAGIILALEYQKLRPEHRILLIEYAPDGGPTQNQLDETINVVEPRNHHLPNDCTNKGLGGTSATWGGRCVMYDEIDFQPRKVRDGQCTWDAQLFHEALRHANRAAEYFECGEARFSLDDIPSFNGSHIAEGFENGEVTDTTIERWSRPTRFGQRYGPQIAASPNLHLLTGWEAHTFDVLAADGKVSEVSIRDFSRTRQAKVKSRRIVLAAGAQETTRLLLKNRQLFQNRGGMPPALGKYYQGHVSGKIASVHFHGDPRKTQYGFLRADDGVYLRRRFQLSMETLQKNELLNTAFWLDNPLYSNPDHHNGVMSFMYLAMITPGLGKRLAPPAIAQAFTKGQPSGVAPHLKNVLKDLPGSLITPAAIFFSRYCRPRKLPGVFLYSAQNFYALHFHAEQEPVPENQMQLAPDGEALNIHYGYTNRDIDSVIRSHEILDQWLRKCRCGELEYWYPKSELRNTIRSVSIDGLHQVGTTRIASSPEAGVVDEQLKVWGTPNLYICSSSVFPTSGQANPTFLLGVFAVRLAHQLAA